MLLLVALPGAAGAVQQSSREARPAAEQQRSAELVSRWQARQNRGVARLGTVRCIEESTRRMDSPHGAREIRIVARLRTHLGRAGVEREIERMEVNGRSIPEDEQHRVLRYLRHKRASDASPEESLLLPAGLLGELQPSSAPRPDPLVRDALRVDLMGAPEDRVERLTLWFEPRTDRLVQSRMLSRPEPNDAPLVVETEYRQWRGVDVPVHRHVEGTMQLRRRSRAFTMLYEQTIAYRW